MSGKNDYGAAHWSSDKVWKRKAARKISAKERDVEDQIMKDLEGLTKTEKVIVLTGAIRRLIGLE